MEAPIPCSDALISDPCSANPGSGANNARPTPSGRAPFFFGDTFDAQFGQNGRDFVRREFNSTQLIENTDQSYAVLLQPRGMQ